MVWLKQLNEQEGTKIFHWYDWLFSFFKTSFMFTTSKLDISCNHGSLGNFGSTTDGVSAGAGGKKKTHNGEAEESLLHEGEDDISHDLGVPLISTTPPEKPLITGGNR